MKMKQLDRIVKVKEYWGNNCPQCNSISVKGKDCVAFLSKSKVTLRKNTCGKCGCSFTHVYTIKYSHTVINTNVSELPEEE